MENFKIEIWDKIGRTGRLVHTHTVCSFNIAVGYIKGWQDDLNPEDGESVCDFEYCIICPDGKIIEL